MIETTNSLKKKERLCSKKDIEKLFENGHRIFAYPIKAFVQNNQLMHQVMFVAPKRNHKKAVDRNRIKRLMKEAYRTQKKTNSGRSYHIAFLYVGKKLPTSEIVHQSINKLLLEIDTL